MIVFISFCCKAIIIKQVKSKAAEFIKAFRTMAKIFKPRHEEMVEEHSRLERIVEESLEKKLQQYRALFAEGLFLLAHSSRSRANLPAARAQLSMIAGELINEADVNPALLKRARDLTSS